MSDETDLDDRLDDLTTKAHAARNAGERIEAQRLFDQRARLSEGQDGEAAAEPDLEPVDAPQAEVPEPLDKDVVDNLMGQLRGAGLEEEVDELQRDWGRDVGANLGYAKEFMTRFGEANPVFGEAVESEIQRDSTLYPAVLRIAARLGRELVHGGHATRPEKGQEKMSESKEAAADAEMDRLTAEAHKAFGRGETTKADKLFRQRSALAERMSGDEPIVGQGLRGN